MSEKFLSERIAEDGVTAEVHMTDGVSEDGYRYYWEYTLRYDGREYVSPNHYGSAEEPDVFDIMDTLTMNCSIVDQVSSREEWAGEFDADWMPEKGTHTEEDWDKWNTINSQLRWLFGPEKYNEYLYNTDRSE